MAAPSDIKSGGLKFAEQQMQRHGWTEGKGLGKREDGISEAIKVKVKCDTAGVGHNSAEQFTFHWWDHVFNKTASSISVEPDQDGVKVKKLSEDDSAVSSKKPRQAMLSRNMLYGRFIKSATLLSGGEKPMKESSSSDTSDSSEDEDSKLDLSSATKLSDEDLMRICGGRTAHKGARHGLTMSAKLSRIEEQERAFMEKYGKKETKLQPSKSTSGVVSTIEINGKKKIPKEGNIDEEQDSRSSSDVPKKKKKKRRKGDCEESEDLPNGHDQEHVPSIEEDAVTSEKKRKSNVSNNIETAEEGKFLGDHKNDLSIEEEQRPTKKKKRRKTEEHEESMTSNAHIGDCRHEEDDRSCENTEEEAGKFKKKKKKKCKRSVEDKELGKEEEEQSSKPKKWSVGEETEENDPSIEERSRKKKKKLIGNEDEPKDGEDSKATKKKKKSKRRDIID